MVVLCAETSTEPRLCAQDPYQGMLFRTGFGADSSLRSERQDTIAQNDRVSQNDRVLLLRMMSTASGGQGEAPVLALSAVPCRQESSEITVSTDTDCPIWNGPFAVRRSESRWAPDPRASPRSLAKALMYVPLLHLMRMSA